MKPLLLLFLVGSIGLSGCSGMKLWEQGDYFQSELTKEFEVDDMSRIGIYVFSDGESRDGTKKPFDAAELVEQIITLPLQILSGSFTIGMSQYGFSTKFFPPAVTADATFEPDTSNAGPSLELATQIKNELKSWGYNPEVVTDLGHRNEVSVAQCLEHARTKQYDGAFIVCYSGLVRWAEYAGTATTTVSSAVSGSSTVTTQLYNIVNGYLYLPNASFFDAKSGERLWNNWFYGIYENAHVFNVSDEPFTIVSDKVVLTMTDSDYFKAAGKAIGTLFRPLNWPDSFTEFPKRVERKGRM